MNFHIFVAIITCVFYIFLRMYKSNILSDENKKDKNKKSKSNFLYILFIPIVLYMTHFLYYKSNENTITGISKIEKPNSLQISEDLLSMPYPESSFRSSNLN